MAKIDSSTKSEGRNYYRTSDNESQLSWRQRPDAVEPEMPDAESVSSELANRSRTFIAIPTAMCGSRKFCQRRSNSVFIFS